MSVRGVRAGHKYRNVITTVDGLRFDSKREAIRYQELQLLERAGLITQLVCQPSFPMLVLCPNGELVRVATYRADFSYHDREAQATIVEDVKGMRTPMYRLKKKHVEAQYGITIHER